MHDMAGFMSIVWLINIPLWGHNILNLVILWHRAFILLWVIKNLRYSAARLYRYEATGLKQTQQQGAVPTCR